MLRWYIAMPAAPSFGCAAFWFRGYAAGAPIFAFFL
jgi:hypothetical protein